MTRPIEVGPAGRTSTSTSPMLAEVAAYLANHPDPYVYRDTIRNHLREHRNDWHTGRRRADRIKRRDPGRGSSSLGSGISEKLGKYLHLMEKRGLIQRHGTNRELVQILDKPALAELAAETQEASP